jgi:hypothetical protein
METVTLPAIFIDLVELAYGLDAGTEQLPLVAHWEARLVMSDALDDQTVWSLVEAVMLALFTARWSDGNIGKAELKQATPDEFSPDLVGHRVWLIEWAQRLRVGDNVFEGEGIVPTEVVIRYQGSDETTTYTLPARSESTT